MSDNKINNTMDDVTDEFTIITDYSMPGGLNYDLQVRTKKEITVHIRDILMTMPDKNGYYTPPYK